MKIVMLFQVQKIQTRGVRIRAEGQVFSGDISALTSFLSLILVSHFYVLQMAARSPANTSMFQAQRKERTKNKWNACPWVSGSFSGTFAFLSMAKICNMKEEGEKHFLFLNFLKLALLALQVKQNFVVRRKRRYWVGT